MLDHEKLKTISEQMMTGTTVQLDGKKLQVKRTSSQRLKTVTFFLDGREYTAIEQNPDKPSRWGQLARDGHRVVQIKDVDTHRFIAVVVDGKVKEYGKLGDKK
jgi:hypothetical protein